MTTPHHPITAGQSPAATERKRLYAFDFDGTLTTRDTLFAFIRHVRGLPALLGGLLLHAPLLVLMKLKLYSNSRAKQRLFSFYFRGMPLEAFDACCRSFAHDSAHLLRPQGLAAMDRALAEGAEVLIVSASIDNWVAPFFLPHRQVRVLGTQVEVAGGRLTGHFASPNCYGAEKVRRVEAALSGPRSHYFITAFGDSRGDRELLAYADQGYYKPFRP